MVKELLSDICSINGINFVVGNEHTVAEMLVKGDIYPQFDETTLHLNSGLWTMHINIDSISKVEIIKDKELSGFIPNLFYISFKDQKNGTIFSVFLPNPYLDEHYNKIDLQEDKMQIIEDLIEKYAGKENIEFLDKSEDTN